MIVYMNVVENPLKDHRNNHNHEPYKIIQVTNYELVLDPVNGYHLKMTKLYDSHGNKIRDKESVATWWFKKLDPNEREQKPVQHVQINFAALPSRGPATTWNPEWPVGMP